MKRILLSALMAVGIAAAQPITDKRTPPKIIGETANGTAITLPDASAGKITFLVLGFSKQGGDLSGSWERHVSEEFAHDAHFAVYTVAMLEDMPGMFRGLAKSGIRNGTPPARREHVVTSTTGEAPWKQFLGVSDAKVPYLVLLDSAGLTRWSGHGPWNESLYQQFNLAAQSLQSEEKAGQKH